MREGTPPINHGWTIEIGNSNILQIAITDHSRNSKTYRQLVTCCSGLHVVLTLLLVELALLLRRGVLVLLVLGHQIVHVALRFRELHLVHPLTGVPVQEGLAPE